MTIDKRFALIADNGDRLYPYKKSQKQTGRYGFALTKPGEQDRHGQGTYTDSIEEVIKRLVFDGWSVRAKTANGNRPGTVGIGKKAIHGYEVAKEFEHLINLASIKPLSLSLLNREKTKSESLTDIREEPIDEITFRAIKSRRGQPEFRKALLLAFGGKCCISGCPVESVLEAAHITPHTKETNYSVSNGILLRADIHTLFDLNLIGIDELGKIMVSCGLKESEYWQFNEQHIAKDVSQFMSLNLKLRYEFYKNNNL